MKDEEDVNYVMSIIAPDILRIESAPESPRSGSDAAGDFSPRFVRRETRHVQAFRGCRLASRGLDRRDSGVQWRDPGSIEVLH